MSVVPAHSFALIIWCGSQVVNENLDGGHDSPHVRGLASAAFLFLAGIGKTF